MSVSLNIKAVSGKDSPEFQKHFKAVQFCIENELSFPKETSEFFRGKVEGDDLEDLEPEYIIERIKDGVEVPIETEDGPDWEIRIKTAKIPKVVDELIIRMEA